MKHRHSHSSWQVLADVMMLMFASMVIIVSLLMISTKIAKQEHSGIKPKAEYLVTMTWDDKRDVDLDMWIRDPFGNVIYYDHREAPNISLDRDSRGFDTNKQQLPDGRVIYSGNREVITLRAITPGNYLVAVSYYEGHDEKNAYPYSFNPPDPKAPIDADVQVEKVNPALTPVFGKKIHLTRVKESFNVVAFHIADDGKVTILPTPPGSLPAEHGAEGGP